MKIQVEIYNGKHKILKRSSNRLIECYVSLDCGIEGYQETTIAVCYRGNKYVMSWHDANGIYHQTVLANVIE